MSLQSESFRKSGTKIIKKCHVCGHIIESQREVEKCPSCKKGFLPLNYFSKVMSEDSKNFKDLFSYPDELDERDLIKGIYVIW